MNKKKETKPKDKKISPKKKGGRISISQQLEQIEQRELKAIQGITDPRRRKFASGYLDPESRTYGNAKQSMLAADFSLDYADKITALKPKWFTDIIRQDDIVEMAMANLREDMSLSIFREKKIGKQTIKIFDKETGKHRREMTQFALKNLSSKFKGNNDDGGAGQNGVFRGAIVKNFTLNYNAPAPVENVTAAYEDKADQGEIIDVQSHTIDIDSILNGL